MEDQMPRGSHFFKNFWKGQWTDERTVKTEDDDATTAYHTTTTVYHATTHHQG